jgi:hypothetical protein
MRKVGARSVVVFALIMLFVVLWLLGKGWSSLPVFIPDYSIEARNASAGYLAVLSDSVDRTLILLTSTFPLYLSPNLAHAIDREVLGKDPHDLRLEGFIALGTARQPRGITALGDMLMIGGWGDWQDPADRLDPVMPAMFVDKGDHRFSRRSSSAWAKYAELSAVSRWLVATPGYPAPEP